MDIILNLADTYLLDDLYARFLPYPSIPSSIPLQHINATKLASPYATSTTYGLPSGVKAVSSLPRDSIIRQSISLFMIAWLGSMALYFIFSTISYYFFFDHRLKHHPRFLKDQIWLEIKSSMIAMPAIDVLTFPIFVHEARGGSMLYSNASDYGYVWMAVSTLLYLVFNDIAIYWIHRIEHHPRLYKHIHKVSQVPEL